MVPNTLRYVTCLLVCTVLVVGPSAPALAGFWEDAEVVGRVAGAVATGGESEVIYQLIARVRAIKDSISKQLDQATSDARNEIQQAVQAQRAIVDDAEKRVNAAVDRGVKAARPYVAQRSSTERARTQEGKTVAPTVATSTKGARVGQAVTEGATIGQEKSTTPSMRASVDDVTLIRQAEARLVGQGRDFRDLAGEIRRGLDLVQPDAEAHVKAMRDDAVKEMLGPLELMLT